jgi:sugar lactone lactonase YvrE
MRANVCQLTTLLLAGGMIGSTQGIVGQAQSEPGSRIETVATIGSSGPTENICQRPDGSIYVTGIDDHVVWKVSPHATTAQKFATVPAVALVIGVAPTKDGVVVTAAERTFRRPGQTPPADFSDVGPQVIMLDKNGSVKARIPGPKGTFFNGITPAGPGKYLIADTAAATVWQFDSAKKQIEVWFKDDMIAGANGIKVHDGWLYLSTRGGRLQRIQIDNGRSKGMPIMFAKDANADDFAITKSGTVYFPRGTTLFNVSPTGEVSHFLEGIPDGPSALLSPDEKWVYWPTRGGDAPQKLLRTAIR